MVCMAGALVTAFNDPNTGILRIGVVNQQGADKVVRATIPYANISILQIGVVEIIKISWLV